MAKTLASFKDFLKDQAEKLSHLQRKHRRKMYVRVYTDQQPTFIAQSITASGWSSSRGGAAY